MLCVYCCVNRSSNVTALLLIPIVMSLQIAKAALLLLILHYVVVMLCLRDMLSTVNKICITQAVYLDIRVSSVLMYNYHKTIYFSAELTSRQAVSTMQLVSFGKKKINRLKYCLCKSLKSNFCIFQIYFVYKCVCHAME